MHTHSGLNSAVLIETDTDLDGKIDDYLWVNGKKDAVGESLLLFNQIHENGKIKQQIWYGPQSQKLVAKSDEDGDGFLETTTFYNHLAKPKVLEGIVARIEIDKTKDNVTNIWIYPGKRMEISRKSNGIPDCFSEDAAIIQKIFNEMPDWENVRKITCKTLPASDSYVLYPERIKDERLKAVISQWNVR
jgi:hypothetical protein